jgi:hypothetical protein
MVALGVANVVANSALNCAAISIAQKKEGWYYQAK